MTNTPKENEGKAINKSLKPCPFCGAPNASLDQNDDSTWYVLCSQANYDCSANVDGFTEAKYAIKNWNMRHG